MKEKISFVFYAISFFSFFLSQNLFASSSNPSMSEEVQRILSGSREKRFNYCVPGTMTCRTLVLLTDKETGLSDNMFYNNFFSSERNVALSGYFLKNSDGTYRAYTDGTFDGKLNIDAAFEWDRKIRMTFDEKGFPKAHELRLKNLGTTKFSIANLTFNEEECTIKGIRYDESNPDFSEPYSVVYKRIY